MLFDLTFLVVHILSTTNGDQSLKAMIFSHPFLDRLQTQLPILFATFSLYICMCARGDTTTNISISR